MEDTNLYIPGLPDFGKDLALLNHLLDRIHKGYGAVVFDTGQELSNLILNRIPPDRTSDVLLFDPTHPDWIVSWNPLAGDSNPYLKSQKIKRTVKALYDMTGASTGVMDLYITKSLQALIEANEPLIGFPHFLTNRVYRDYVIENGGSWDVWNFWEVHNSYDPKRQSDQIGSTYNKADPLTTDPYLQRLLSFSESSFKADYVFDGGDVVIVRLPKSILDEDQARIIASLLLMEFVEAMYRREPHDPFFFYLPEADLVADSVMVELLRYGPSYNCYSTLSHEYISQISKGYFEAIMGTCANKYIFRISEPDGLELEKTLPHNNNAEDLDKLEWGYARKFPHDNKNLYFTVLEIEHPEYKTSYARIMDSYRRSELTYPVTKAKHNINEFRKKLK